MLASSQKIITALAIVGLSTAATIAVAEQLAPPMPGPAMERHGPWGADRPHMMPSQMVEARLAFLKTALQITPAQTAQWNAVADVMRKHAKARDAKFAEMHAKMDAMKDGDKRPDPIARLEHHQKMLTETSADMGELITFLKPLYATLSDSQKEIAGEVLERHGGMMGHGPGMGHGEER